MTLLALAYALALGFILGLERGWSQRSKNEGQRFAGLRTFSLTGLFGGVVPLLAEQVSPSAALAIWLLVFASIAALVIVAHVLEARDDGDFGITTPLALLLTFVLGSLCTLGFVAIAVPVAIVAALLLSLKPLLHGWLERLQERELLAILQMLVISVVVLPLLPNEGYGPGGVLNPFMIGWMVVLITGISFVGYFAIKLLGSHRGVLLTGVLGGLASSTAVTLALAQLSKLQKHSYQLFSGAILLAAGTMFPRMLVEVSVVNPLLVRPLLVPLLVMMAVTYVGVAWLIWHEQRSATPAQVSVANPFDILTALKFAVLLVVILIVAHYAHQYFDAAGIYAVAAISGLTDVDAITLSIAKLARDELGFEVAVPAVLLAASVNTLVKAGLVVALAHQQLRRAVLMISVAALISGWLSWWLML